MSETGKAAASFLTNQLYPDLKSWVATLYRNLRIPLKKTFAPSYNSPSEFLDSVAHGRINDGDVIKIRCKPSNFGSFLRTHIIMPFVGSQSSMRLGPPLAHPHPILGLAAQTTSHLQPVGLFCPLDKHIQVSLLPYDATASGFMRLVPGVNEIVTSVSAIFPARFLPFLHASCDIVGVVRLIPPQLALEIGLKMEDYESHRRAGNIWFVDCTTDEAECTPTADNIKLELWGALYASGHLEISEGELPLVDLIEVFEAAFKNDGFQPNVLQNRAGQMEVGVFSHGLRALVGSKAPFFALHMDAEIAIEFQSYRKKFDKITQNILTGIARLCDEQSVKLSNSMDVDFTYTDSATAFTVLRSLGANEISDPLAIAIRDWHRKREANE